MILIFFLFWRHLLVIGILDLPKSFIQWPFRSEIGCIYYFKGFIFSLLNSSIDTDRTICFTFLGGKKLMVKLLINNGFVKKKTWLTILRLIMTYFYIITLLSIIELKNWYIVSLKFQHSHLHYLCRGAIILMIQTKAFFSSKCEGNFPQVWIGSELVACAVHLGQWWIQKLILRGAKSMI